MDDDKNPFEIIRKPSHEIDPELDVNIQLSTDSGEDITVGTFRPVEGDEDLISGRIEHPSTDEDLIGEIVIFPKQMAVAQKKQFEIIRARKGKWVSIGSFALTAAAGVGLLVRRHKRKAE